MDWFIIIFINITIFLIYLIVHSSLNHENLFLFLIGIFTIYLILAGNRALTLNSKIKEKIDKMVTENQIEIVPFAFMRGRTFPNYFVIVDECQNITHSQTEMMLGRLGKGGKIVFCGDLSQVDLKSKKDSGIGFFPRLEERIK